MTAVYSFLLALSLLLSSVFGFRAPDGSGPAMETAPRTEITAKEAITAKTAAAKADDGTAAPDTGDALRDAPALPDRTPEDGLAYAAMEYVHYDPSVFYDDVDRMTALAHKGSTEEVLALYDRLYDEFLYIDSLAVLAMLRYDADFRDEYRSEEYTYINTVYSEAQDALMSACSEVLRTDVGDAFAEHVGDDTAAVFYYYDAETDYDAEAARRELALLDEYYLLCDEFDSLTYTFRGRDWTQEDLNGFRGDLLAYEDYDAYLEVYDGLQKAVNDAAAPVYLDLVSLWTKQARDAGCDSYADYAYENVFDRDYTTDDAQRFCDAVKPIARAYYAGLYYSDLYYDRDKVRPAYTGRELIELMGEYLPRVDESLLAPWRDMTARGLYDVDSPASGRYDGAYTTVMLHYRAPFLFATLAGGCDDLITLTHEFGHFSDYWFTPQTDYFSQTDDLDLSEIHSNALQALFSAFYGEIYDRRADAAEFADLSDLLENILDGCFYDEFQRRVFAEADGLTAERLNEIHVELAEEYGLYEPGSVAWDSSWAYIPHNFSQPMYYISYAASAMAALQIWDMAQTDFQAAAQTYLGILRQGSYDAGYTDVLRDAGLRLFSEEGAVEEVCRPVLARLEALDAAR